MSIESATEIIESVGPNALEEERQDVSTDVVDSDGRDDQKEDVLETVGQEDLPQVGADGDWPILHRRKLQETVELTAKKPGTKNEPSRVVHIALIPPSVRDEDLAFIVLAFGDVKLLLYIRKKRHALVFFEHQEDAEAMVDFFARHPGEMFGVTLSIEFSNHKDLNLPAMSRSVANTQTILKNAKQLKETAELGVPGSVLRVVSKSAGSMITLENIYRAFYEFGTVLKIVISKRPNPTDPLEAFVQMKDADCAKRACRALDNQKIGGGYGRVEVTVARDQTLAVKFNNARSRDFTNPTLLLAADMPADGSIDLSAGLTIAEGSQNILYQLSRLVGVDLDRSLSLSPSEIKRRMFSSSPPLGLQTDEFSPPSVHGKRRRAEPFLASKNEPYEPFEETWPGRQRMLDDMSSGHGRLSPSAPLSGSNRDDIVDQLLMLRSSRGAQPSIPQSLVSPNGRLDPSAIAAARQILAERAMSAIANDPYARLLNALISNSESRPAASDPLRQLIGSASSRRSSLANDDSLLLMQKLGTSFGSPESGRGSKVLLVSNLNSERINPDALFTLFGVYGDVQRVKLMFTRAGSALVQMTTPDQAVQAIANLDGIMLYGKRLRISISKYSEVQVSKDSADISQWGKNYEDSTLHRYRHPGSRNCMNIYPPSEHLHLSNICDDTTREELMAIFEPFGRVVNLRFFETDRRMGVVEMESVEAACEALIGAHNHMLQGGRRLRISFARQKR